MLGKREPDLEASITANLETLALGDASECFESPLVEM
jgi:hypothetical protein